VNIAFLLWGGAIGGTERLSLALAGEIQSRGISTSVVFAATEGKLGGQLRRESLKYYCANLYPGRMVLRHPNILAATVASTRADVVVVGSFGYLGPAVKLGGFKGHVIGVEHGALLTLPGLPLPRRLIRRAERRIGARFHDAEVEVSRYMFDTAQRTAHARRLVCIKHGVKVPATPMELQDAEQLRLGYVGRLIPGKGVDVVLRALARLGESASDSRPNLTVAGDGPDRQPLEELTRELGLGAQVEFVGWTEDIAGFWSSQHVSVATSNEFVESFCMTAVEAMANGRPSIVSDRGALPELVVPDVTGSIVRPGDVAGIAAAIGRYSRSPELVAAQGAAAHLRAREFFSIEVCVDSYLELVQSLLED
jgi:glycosyltransferase involved in cell wall biosynthesis